VRGEGISFLVDCGLQQGSKYAQDANHTDFSYDPKSIDLLIITHAHMDHIGRIPKLVRDGFRGAIISTPQTKEIAPIMFADALGLMRKESKDHQTPMLYEETDIAQAMALWTRTYEYHEVFELAQGMRARLLDAGHILGSAMLEITYQGKKMVFTGDLGNSPSPLLRDTEALQNITYLVMESVYGDRNHGSHEVRDKEFRKIVASSVARGGALVIPTFSIERTQVMLYELNEMVENKEIPSVPVFLDSPLAQKVTEVYRRHSALYNDAVQAQIRAGDDVFSFPKLEFSIDRRDSEAISRVKNPKIILAGSGMSAGGRVISHERNYLEDPKSTILFVGYQMPGSLGRELQEGAKKVRIGGEEIHVHAHIETVGGFSAHKDSDGLVEFVSHTASTLKHVFVAMGEAKAGMFLCQRLRDELGVLASFPEKDVEYRLEF
jgi:metallo-beta-lactamase family protein